MPMLTRLTPLHMSQPYRAIARLLLLILLGSNQNLHAASASIGVQVSFVDTTSLGLYNLSSPSQSTLKTLTNRAQSTALIDISSLRQQAVSLSVQSLTQQPLRCALVDTRSKKKRQLAHCNQAMALHQLAGEPSQLSIESAGGSPLALELTFY